MSPVSANKRPPTIALAIAAIVFLASCAVPISYYDVTTYRNLTDLKVETTTLVESFDTLDLAENEARIQMIYMSLRKAHEYEKGKGQENSETMKQFKLILGMFEDDVADYRQSAGASLGPTYFREAAVTLAQAFDIAIATESAKNHDKD